jgi:hypothetical protein
MEGVPPIILGTKNVKNFYVQSLDTLGAPPPPAKKKFRKITLHDEF